MTDDEANDAFDPEADRTPEFDAEVRPLMSQVLEVCRLHGIPFVALFQVSAEVFSEHCSIPSGAAHVIRSIDEFIENAREIAGDLN